MRYLEVQKLLAQEITGYGVHQSLASERVLALKYQCSRETIRRALESLHADGKIFKCKDVGWLSSGKKIKYDLSSTRGFTDYAAAQGFQPSSKIISSHISSVDADIAQHFKHLNAEQLCVEIIRVRYINQIPVMLEYNYLPYPDFANVLNHDLQQSLVSILENHFSQRYSSSSLNIKHGRSDSFAQHILMTPPHQSAIQIERINKNNNEVFEFDIEIWRDDQVEFGLQIGNATSIHY